MKSAAPPATARRRLINLAWLAAYLLAIGAVVVAVLRARETTLHDLGTPEARADWEAWRKAEPNRAGSGPVQRKPPTVNEPPALLLMRDHFVVVIAGAVMFSSLLFAAIMIAARGVFSANAKPDASDAGMKH